MSTTMTCQIRRTDYKSQRNASTNACSLIRQCGEQSWVEHMEQIVIGKHWCVCERWWMHGQGGVMCVGGES